MTPPKPDHDADHDAVMDQVARECMNAIEHKDKEAFIQAFQVLLADLMDKMQASPDEDMSEKEME